MFISLAKDLVVWQHQAAKVAGKYFLYIGQQHILVKTQDLFVFSAGGNYETGS